MLPVTTVGFVEELLFRGCLLRTLRTDGTTASAVIISAATVGAVLTGTIWPGARRDTFLTSRARAQRLTVSRTSMNRGR